MLDYKVVSLVENKLGEVQDQRERDAMIKYLIQEADFEIAYYLVCTYITKRNVMDLHKSIISNISNSKSTLDLAPRGFGKSTVGDVDYCITRILRDPNIRIMIGSKTQTQAEAFLKEVRTHFEQNEDLIRIFGDWKTSKDNVWNDREFTVNKRSIIKKEATLTALGASGAVISKHFDVIIGDDLVGLENARTEKQRSNLKEWFYSSLFPTLEPDGEIHILGTRYNPLDLYEDLIKSTFGELWLDGDYVGECYKAQAKVEFTKEEIKQCGTFFTDNKVVGCKGTGSLTMHKVNSRMAIKVANMVRNKQDVRFTLISKLADPDAYGAERVSITGVQMDDLTLFDWEAQKPLETEAPFTFTGYEYLDQITPQ